MAYRTPLPPGMRANDEVLTRRTLTSKIFKRAGEQKGRFHIGHIHHPSWLNRRRMEEVDTTLRAYSDAQIGGGGGWSFGTQAGPDARAAYMVRLPSDSSEWVRFRNLIHDRGADVSAYEQFGIKPHNRPGVPGMLETQHEGWSKQSVVWPDAMGPGMHLRAICGNGQLNHVTQIDALPAGLGQFLTLDFEIGADFTIRTKDGVWDKQTTVLTSGAVLLGDTQGQRFFLRDFRAWDSTLTNSISIQVEFRQVAPNRYAMRKRIPTAWLQTAVFPVYTDASSSTFAGAGDGYVEYSTSAGGTWAEARDATTGTTAAPTSSTSLVQVEEWGSNNWNVYRTFLPFDISSIGSGETITAGDINCYVTLKADNDNDSEAYITLVEGTQASNTTLTTADFDAIGTTEGIDSGQREDITSITTSAYFTMDLNSTGLGWADPEGWAKYGLREGHDNTDTAVANNKDNKISMNTSEQTGTSNDPYLDLTFSRQGASALDGSGTLAASANKTAAGASALDGDGTLASTANKTAAGASSLSGTGALASTANKTASGKSALTGDGTLASAATKTAAGAAALSGTGTLGVTGSGGVPGGGGGGGSSTMKYTGATE